MKNHNQALNLKHYSQIKGVAHSKNYHQNIPKIYKKGGMVPQLQ